jgi:hypothetical protein
MFFVKVGVKGPLVTQPLPPPVEKRFTGAPESALSEVEGFALLFGANLGETGFIKYNSELEVIN